MYFVVLYRNRKRQISELDFFIHDYKRSYKYWEVVECAKRCMLGGAAVFFTRGSLIQIASSTIIVLLYLLLIQRCQPYQKDNAFAFAANLCLFGTLFLAIFVKLLAGWSSKGIYEEGYTPNQLTSLLIMFAAFTMCDLIAQIIVRMYFTRSELEQEERRMKTLPAISAKLAALPREDPPPGPDFYAIQNPVNGTAQQKLDQLKLLRTDNVKMLEGFFDSLDQISDLKRVTEAKTVIPGSIFIKLNSKTDASTLGKALRPLLLAKYPSYGVEHVRDNLRFKCITASVTDAFVFLELLINKGWEVIKMDVDKFVQPKEWVSS
jgi:hypothetical protein